MNGIRSLPSHRRIVESATRTQRTSQGIIEDTALPDSARPLARIAAVHRVARAVAFARGAL